MKVIMRLTRKEMDFFLTQLSDLMKSEQVHKMKHCIQHGKTSTFAHCFTVAYYSYLISLHLSFHMDHRSIIRGAFLHDFYLYDWHIPDKSHKFHGFVHPVFALENAKKYFDLSPIEADIIVKHMWPLTITKIPKKRETFLVCMIDKFCSLAETFYLSILPRDYDQMYKTLHSDL
jgi:uncharacterized protein